MLVLNVVVPDTEDVSLSSPPYPSGRLPAGRGSVKVDGDIVMNDVNTKQFNRGFPRSLQEAKMEQRARGFSLNCTVICLVRLSKIPVEMISDTDSEHVGYA